MLFNKSAMLAVAFALASKVSAAAVAYTVYNNAVPGCTGAVVAAGTFDTANPCPLDFPNGGYWGQFTLAANSPSNFGLFSYSAHGCPATAGSFLTTLQPGGQSGCIYIGTAATQQPALSLRAVPPGTA